LFLLCTIVIVCCYCTLSLLYCTFIMYPAIRLSSRKCAINSVFSVQYSLLPKNGETTAKFGDCRTFLRQWTCKLLGYHIPARSLNSSNLLSVSLVHTTFDSRGFQCHCPLYLPTFVCATLGNAGTKCQPSKPLKKRRLTLSSLLPRDATYNYAGAERG